MDFSIRNLAVGNVKAVRELDNIGNFHLFTQLSQPCTLLDNPSQSYQVIVVFIYPSVRV